MPDGFHDAFLAAIGGDATALAPWRASATAAAGLSVYRNTIAKGCADALTAQFPTVERIVGARWLEAAAAAHAADHPPAAASLLTYGEAFPEWLTDFAPAAGMPFLANLARIDLMWTGADLGEDAPALDASTVTGLTSEALAHRALVLHPATRFAWFEDGSPRLWCALQPPAEPPASYELEAERLGLLIVRPTLEVAHRLIGAGAFAFLSACGAGKSLAEAGLASIAAEPDLDLAVMFAGLVSAGAFSDLRIFP